MTAAGFRLATVRVREATLFAGFVAAVVRAGFARRTIFFGIAFPLAAECVRETVVLAGFVAAVARTGFARRTVFFGIAFPLVTRRVREVVLFAVRARDGVDFVSITNYPTLVEDLQKLATFG